MGDVSSLFDPGAAPRKRKTSAEARSQARRCTSCQGFVPAGMSICQVCGLDQETGVRIDLDEDLGPKQPAAAPGPPLHIAIVGGICGVSGIVLVLVSAVISLKQESAAMKYGWLCLALVSAFGAYQRPMRIRKRTLPVKLLMLAATLGVFVNLAGNIALPIIRLHHSSRRRNKLNRSPSPEIPRIPMTPTSRTSKSARRSNSSI